MQREVNKGKWLFGKQQWHTTELSRFSGPVPADVLELALKVRENVGGRFQVEYLAKEELERRYNFDLDDPFLLVRADENSPWHHIAVWNEPKFIV